MSIQKIYRKYGKRVLASILAILLSVQTPLLSYADTSDFEISSYDDVAERPVWDDSEAVDYNSFDEISKRELVPLSQEEIDYIMEHDGEFNPESPLVDDLSENSDTLTEDNEISAQSVVAIGAGVTALIIFLLSALSSAEVVQNGNANTLYDSLTSLSKKDSDWFEYFYYRYAGVVYTVEITAAKAKSLLDKLDKSLSSDGKTCSVALTTEDKEVLSYALDKKQLITSLDSKSVNIKSMDGFNYYYVLSCGFDYDMTSKTVKVLCTPNKVDLSDRIYTSSSNFQSRFLFYNALLADQSNPYSSMKYRIATYKLSSATGLFEYTGNYYEYLGTSNSNRYDLEQFGVSELRSLPFPVVGKKGATNFLNYFEVKSALILDESLKGKITSIDSVMGLKSIYYKGDISDVLNTEKNFFGQVTALSPGAGSVIDTTDSGTTTKPGTDSGGGSGSTTTDTENTGILKQLLTLITSMESAVKALSIGSIGTLLTVDLINALAKSSFISGITTLLSSISTGVNNIANWDIDNWAEYSASILASLKSIDNIETLIGNIADFTVDNFPDVLESSLSSLGFADIVNMANVLKIWNIDTVGETIVTSINNALSKLGLATIPKDIFSFKESVDSKLIESAALLTAIKNALGSLTVSPDLSGLSDILKNVLTALGLGSLLGAVTSIGEIVKGMSFADIIAAIKALPASIAAEIAKVIPSQGNSDNENQNDSGFTNFLNLFMITLLILVILIILFINCLRFIVLVFNIPASTTLLPDDILTGIQYLKDLQLPLFGVSLYTLLLSCAYFIIFMTVIMTLRRKIDKIHI